MHSLRHILLVVSILSTVFSISAQNDKVKKFRVMFPVCGYTWQGTHNIDLGFQPMLLLDAKKDHSNFGLVITGNLMYLKKAFYFTPMTKLKLMPHKRKKFLHLAWSAAIGHSYTQINHKYDHRLTPEVAVKWEWYNLSVGYNIPISGYRDGHTTLFRAALSLNLF